MALVTIPLLGYAPDMDPAAPGVFSYCLGMEATVRGWSLRRTFGSIGATTFFSAGNPAVYLVDGLVSNTSAGTEVYHLAVAGTAGGGAYKYFRYAAAALVDCSKASGTYSATDNVSFAQYGNYTIATNLTDVLQIRDASGVADFADSVATGIPKAKIAVPWGPPNSRRIMLLHYNDGANTYTDGWWSSHQGGPTAPWTPDIATGAANGRLEGAGIIRCGIAYRDNIIVFGDRSMWLGSFVGPPYVVEWVKLSEEVGCCAQNAATVCNGILYWVGKQGIFQFDGEALQKAPFPIQQEVFKRVAAMGATNERQVRVYANSATQKLWISTGDNSGTGNRSVEKWYAINLLNNKVGVLPATTASITYKTHIILDRGVIGIAHTLNEQVALAAESTGPYAAPVTELHGFGLNYIGADKGDTTIHTILPRFVTAPSTYKLTNYYGPTMSEALSNTTTAVTVSATPWRADVRQAARWHAPRLHFSSNGTVDVEMIDAMADVAKSGNQ